MYPLKSRSIIVLLAVVAFSGCSGTAEKTSNQNEEKKINIKEETVTYAAGPVSMNGFVAYNEASDAKRPVVIIVHEWWGLNDYTKNRARQLAALGYLTMAVDMYGNGEVADNPDKAKTLAMPFYQNPQMAKERFDAALAKIKTHPDADTTKIAAIGYCFGGGLVLNVARLGENLNGVVCFHGSLIGVPANKNLLKADVLVCQGDSDKFVTPGEVAKFETEMDSIRAPFTIKHYANATHAFTNPAATETGKKFSMPIRYNAEADTASFNDMLSFFGKIFR